SISSISDRISSSILSRFLRCDATARPGASGKDRSVCRPAVAAGLTPADDWSGPGASAISGDERDRFGANRTARLGAGTLLAKNRPSDGDTDEADNVGVDGVDVEGDFGCVCSDMRSIISDGPPGTLRSVSGFAGRLLPLIEESGRACSSDRLVDNV